MTGQSQITLYAVRSGAGWIVSPVSQGKVERMIVVSGLRVAQRETVADIDKWQADLVRRGVKILLVSNL